MEYVCTALIPTVAAAIVVILAKRIAAHAFQCKHCAHTFRIKWKKVLVTQHSGDAYMLACPHCGTKDWCIQQSK